jgi:hypothetical protein
VKDESYKEKVSTAFTELESTTLLLGNLLSHDNPLIDKVSISEVKGFCNRVHDLHGLFLCPSCGYFIGYFPELNILRCPNERCKNPLEIKTK